MEEDNANPSPVKTGTTLDCELSMMIKIDYCEFFEYCQDNKYSDLDDYIKMKLCEMAVVHFTTFDDHFIYGGPEYVGELE